MVVTVVASYFIQLCSFALQKSSAVITVKGFVENTHKLTRYRVYQTVINYKHFLPVPGKK